MNDKREWYQAELWDCELKGWVDAVFQDGIAFADAAKECERFAKAGLKTRIVRHTTEIVEEREARG